jgi:uncharacterized membrane protein YqjE
MTIEENSAAKGGLLDSVKALASTLIAMGQTRLELLSTEIEEEREWLTSMMIWTLVALFCAAIAVVLAAMLIVIIFWDSYRILALSLLICVFILGAGFAWRMVFNITRNKPRLFTSSIEEMSKDREKLSPPYE